ncbi:CaiB/BaiF CoA transferase family protein [Arthrobacter sp. EPSL27]|uniref:CaiB/BaiF CoA transferase family protein n=1 Tax=Arthrobacter sp. EPSL27 TaxID=1745378 RepID=UPI00074A4275|nr:CaiB/BaiF CoA-transferase family protein [Arthrobacter sp. EPSL27]KUM37394.1 CoA-transferase [Arthrobacter sp. EPSL27]
MDATTQKSTTAAAGPLAGITVLDLSRALAGPYATALLADMGATVIKVESIKGGDSSRSWPPFEDEHSLYFDSVNRGKNSIAVDFYTPEGKELLRKLALDADVLIENFRPEVLATMGLDPEELRAANPGLIIASITGFGTTGPLALTAGLDQVAQGMSGLMSVTGQDTEHMVRFGVPIVDMCTGMFAAYGIAAALNGRARTGSGLDISTSLLESALALSAFQGQRYLSNGETPAPQGNDHPVLAPYGVFKTADIPVIIAVGNDKQWHQLCGLVGDPALAHDPDYLTGRDRSTNRKDLTRRLEEHLTDRPGLDWLAAFRAAKIPCGPIYNYAEVFADPQVQAVDMLRTVNRHDGTELPLLRGPLSVNGDPTPVRKAPPALGEDTRKILEDLALTPGQIEKLITSGIVHETRAADRVQA